MAAASSRSASSSFIEQTLNKLNLDQEIYEPYLDSCLGGIVESCSASLIGAGGAADEAAVSDELAKNHEDQIEELEGIVDLLLTSREDVDVDGDGGGGGGGEEAAAIGKEDIVQGAMRAVVVDVSTEVEKVKAARAVEASAKKAELREAVMKEGEQEKASAQKELSVEDATRRMHMMRAYGYEEEGEEGGGVAEEEANHVSSGGSGGAAVKSKGKGKGKSADNNNNGGMNKAESRKQTKLHEEAKKKKKEERRKKTVKGERRA